MRIEFAFRLSTYLTLGLAYVSLAYAERAYLPEVIYFVVPAVVLLLLAPVVEKRWVLPIWAANLLGLIIAVGVGTWTLPPFWHALNAPQQNVMIPATVLPFVGPLLMALILVKAYRPKKLADYWVLHGLGLLLIGLGCTLASDPVFGALLLAYFACALWCLALFYLYREQLQAVAPPRAPMLPWRSQGLGPAAGWTVGVALMGLLLFLLTPRHGDAQWNLFNLFAPNSQTARLRTGLTIGGIDLNRTGVVEVNDEVALHVQAEDANHAPKRDLDEGQRWRAEVLDRYRDGLWRMGHSWQFVQHMRMGGPNAPRQRRYGPGLPDFGPRQVFLTFTVQPRKAGGLVLADPVLLQPGQEQLPVLFRDADNSLASVSLFEHHGTLISFNPRDRAEYQYQQVTLPPPAEDRDLSHPVDVDPHYVSFLRWPPSRSRLLEWTNQLLERLAGQPGYLLTAEDVRVAHQFRQPLPDDTETGVDPQVSQAQEKVARALTRYLASSSDYTYSLELRREDPAADPIEDFLIHVKQGHCERFAGALALMLRTQAIPARVVKGFRGAEDQGDGRYVVRNSHAHAWVEALVWRPDAAGRLAPRWLTLEPTPGGEALAAVPFSWTRWWEHVQQTGLGLWKDFIIGYDPDLQEHILWELNERLTAGKQVQALVIAPARRLLSGGEPLLAGLGLVLAALGALWLVRRARQRRDAGGTDGRLPSVPFYARLLALLAEHARLRPEPAQTPREFGEQVRRLLAGTTHAAPLADVPVQVANLYYRVRFGRLPLTEAEQADVEGRLDRLAMALATY